MMKVKINEESDMYYFFITNFYFNSQFEIHILYNYNYNKKCK